MPAEQAFQFFATVKDASTLHVNWEIAKGYYLYREQIQLELTNAVGNQLGNYSIPRGTPAHDEAFGQVETFHNELGFDLPIIRANSSAQTITLQAKYQGCADRGVCYPPMTKKIDLELPVAQDITPIVSTNPTPALSEQDQIVQSLQHDSLAMTLLSFFGFGLLLSMTPCIFPMIPILSGIIVGHGNSHYHRQSVFPVPQLCCRFSFHLHGVWHTRCIIRQQSANNFSATLDNRPVQRHFCVTVIIHVWFL